jgi:hypothetical protein
MDPHHIDKNKSRGQDQNHCLRLHSSDGRKDQRTIKTQIGVEIKSQTLQRRGSLSAERDPLWFHILCDLGNGSLQCSMMRFQIGSNSFHNQNRSYAHSLTHILVDLLDRPPDRYSMRRRGRKKTILY